MNSRMIEEPNEIDIDLVTPKLSNFKEAIQSLNDVQEFLESRGYIQEALKLVNSRHFNKLKLKTSQQTSLYDYIINNYYGCTTMYDISHC